MAKINIFKEFILTGFLEDTELDKLILETLEKYKLEKKQRILSNKGGFQTTDIINTDITNQIILKKLLSKSINILSENFKFITNKVCLTITDAWINNNNVNDYNVLHDHLPSDLAGIYYTRAFPEQGGELVFHRDNSKLIDNSKLKNLINNSEVHTQYTIIPQNHMFILFPGYVSHSVNESKINNRISTAFNINIIT